jgi:hypothetical protein
MECNRTPRDVHGTEAFNGHGPRFGDEGGRVRPTITPDDPDAVERILKEHQSWNTSSP